MDKSPLHEAQYKTPDNLAARANLHKRFSDAAKPWHPWVFDQFEILPPIGCILEVGCGPGWLWRQNLTRIPGDWRLFLSDFSEGMVGDAKRHLARQQTQFTVADAQSLPFAANIFDALIANHMLYHVPDRPRAIAEFARVLKPGGRLYASTIGADHLQEIERLARRFQETMSLAPGWRADMATDFLLEHAAAEFQPHFAEVEMRPFSTLLRVDEAAPLADYILSTASSPSHDMRLALIDFLQQDLDRRGIIEIGTSSGLFIAR